MTGGAVTYETGSSAETERLGAELAAGLQAGDVVLVQGELGAGKTTFVRGACRALGVTGRITSPTFTLGQRYPLSAERAPAAVAHLDLYRISSLELEEPDLLADYVNADTIAFVEWPEGSEAELGALGNVAATVRLEHAGGERRHVEVRLA